ncbi:MAG TPA: 50S ribosomal protein L24 [Anaerolineales bacterium]|nr:50S ribosomal protein L24 [Anaerolineales bacterium]
MKVKIRKGDIVEVISGRLEDKGRRGEVIRVYPEDQRVVVQGVNLRKKHQRQVQTQGRSLSPGIIEFEAPVSISNVMLVCPSCSQPARVGVVRSENGVQRMCKKCQATFD